ncbi:pilus assembly PilX N-terminal domain-containing protein [Candidatus Saccharibacteria bacterium]|nr:pilus assembly PilX N-terminal domain-containing protein [Candidatus Saccharibacteria bacterium]
MRSKKFGVVKSNSAGIASFTVVIIIMMISTLLVLSFATVVRREQRRALDKQLSSQALYAAETGVRDVQQAVQAGLIDPTDPSDDISDCNDFTSLVSPSGGGDEANIVEGNVEYSCALVDFTPDDLDLTLSQTSGQRLVPITPVGGANPNRIRISWEDEESSSEFWTSSAPALPDQANFPMMRVVIMPVPNGQSIDAFNNSTQTLFLYPNAGPQNTVASINYTGALSGDDVYNNGNQGAFVNGNCNTGKRLSSEGPYACSVDITGISGGEYIVGFLPLYDSLKTNVAAFETVPGGVENSVEIQGAQAIIDVTGKAEDVLRRIRVRVPIQFGAELEAYETSDPINSFTPIAAINSKSAICKLWERTNSEVTTTCPGGPASPIPF